MTSDSTSGINAHRPGGFSDPREIEWIVLDVDGVLTDGSVLLDACGRELKRFNIRDGLGIRAWQREGFGVALITGRAGGAVQHRCAELGIGEVVLGSADKPAAFGELCARRGIRPEHVACMGDDWPDLGLLNRVGYPTAPADAASGVRERVAWVSPSRGGRGAVRELCEHLLRARGRFEHAMALHDR